MKKVIIVLIVALISTSLFSQGIKFENGSLNEAIEKAKQENKIVFVDCYTTWCGPCKWMSKEIFTNKEVGDYFNQNFVSLKIDMEKGEGPGVGKIYNVLNFPTMLFIDTEGTLLHKIVGGKQVDELIVEAQNALNPSKRITTMDAKYNNGNREINFLLNYFNALNQASDKQKIVEVAKHIVTILPIENFGNKDMFKILTKANIELGSEEYKYILNNEDELKLEVGEQAYFELLDGIISNYLLKQSRTVDNLDELKAAIEDCKQIRVTNNQAMMEENMEYEYYLSRNDFITWYNLKMDKAKKVEGSSEYIFYIFDLSHYIYENPKFDEGLDIVNKVIEKAHTIANTKVGAVFGNFSLAKLYVRTKNKDAALKHFNLFISLNKESNGNNDHITVTSLKDAIDAL